MGRGRQDRAETVAAAYRAARSPPHTPDPPDPPQEDTSYGFTAVADHLIDHIPDQVRQEAETDLDALMQRYGDRYDDLEALADHIATIAPGTEPPDYVEQEQTNSQWNYCNACLDEVTEQLDGDQDAAADVGFDPRFRETHESKRLGDTPHSADHDHRRRTWHSFRCPRHPEHGLRYTTTALIPADDALAGADKNR